LALSCSQFGILYLRVPLNMFHTSSCICIFGLELFTIWYIVFTCSFEYVSYIFMHIGEFHLTIKLWPNLIVC
jgi:hypothetical protein